VKTDNVAVVWLLVWLSVIPLSIWAMQLLWNYVMPPMFGVPDIGYMQMAALWLLVRLFTGTWFTVQR